MKLPENISGFIKAQNELDSTAFANYFTAHATVSDEGSSYSGREEIKQWIQAAIEKYNMQLTPKDNYDRMLLINDTSSIKLRKFIWELIDSVPTAGSSENSLLFQTIQSKTKAAPNLFEAVCP